jgi:hypothetical protein
MGKRPCSKVNAISVRAMYLADTFLAGRLKVACDLIAHHLPPDVKTELMSAYEYVTPSLKFR